MSAISIGPLGVIEGDPLIARAETKLLKRAEKLVVLADASKFVARGSLVVCPLSRIHALITDRARRRKRSRCCAEAGVQTCRGRCRSGQRAATIAGLMRAERISASVAGRTNMPAPMNMPMKQ